MMKVASLGLAMLLISAAGAAAQPAPPPGGPGGPPQGPPAGPPGLGIGIGIGGPPPPPPPPHVGPPQVMEEGPSCRLVRQRYWDGYEYRVRRVEVCD